MACSRVNFTFTFYTRFLREDERCEDLKYSVLPKSERNIVMRLRNIQYHHEESRDGATAATTYVCNRLEVEKLARRLGCKKELTLEF
jgi:hypothetical protein